MSGANSIFYGENLLTTENNSMEEDRKVISTFNDFDSKILNELNTNDLKNKKSEDKNENIDQTILLNNYL